MQTTYERAEPGLGELILSLWRGLASLLQQEAEFAFLEVSKQMAHVRKGVILLAVAGVFGYTGFLLLLATVVVGLTYLIPLWASVLVTGLALALIALVLLFLGLNYLKAQNIKPHHAVEVVKEDMTWMRRQISSTK